MNLKWRLLTISSDVFGLATGLTVSPQTTGVCWCVPWRLKAFLLKAVGVNPSASSHAVLEIVREMWLLHTVPPNLYGKKQTDEKSLHRAFAL
jgi:hypothetical protein